MTKNFKGGYKIVSLNGNDLASGDSFVVNGLYENLVNSYKKPILVTEIVIDGEKQQDSFAVVKQSDGGYTIDVYGYALTVTSEDAVTIAVLPEITSIGTGLTLTDGELSASGGLGQLYVHNIVFTYTEGSGGSAKVIWQFRFNITNTVETAYTSYSDILSYFESVKTTISPSANGFTINGCGFGRYSDEICVAISMSQMSGGYIYLSLYKTSSPTNFPVSSQKFDSPSTVVDNVIKIQ